MGEYVEPKHDPLIVEVKIKHFLDMENAGRAFMAHLRNWNGGVTSALSNIRFSYHLDQKEFCIEYVEFNVEAEALFECLKWHLPDDVWASVNKLKETIRQYLEISCLMEDVEHDVHGAKDEMLKRLGPTVDWHLPSQLWFAIRRDIVNIKHDLLFVISRRVFPGKCPACPD